MAYVAISSALIDSTSANIERMKNKERSSIPETPYDMTLDANDPLAMQMAWGTHVHLRSVIPEGWTQSVSRICVVIPVTSDGITWTTEFTLRSQNGSFVVPNLRSNGYDSINVKITDEHSFTQTVAAQHIANMTKLREIDNKWKKIKSEVKEFLNASKSLNEALKLWPALALYISDSYINRVNTNAKREACVSRAAEVLAKIQTDEITAAAVASKLTV